MNKQFSNKRILIAPLDWGLGHATRCIPIIRHLLFLKCEVVIAASSNAKSLLQTEFPQLKFLNINAYNIVYSANKRRMPFKILIQIPKILNAIKKEHNWLQQLIKQQNFDAIISDNRYGLYTSKILCIFITHQLQINTSSGFLKNLIRRINYKYINKFSECWIPDFEGNFNISGELAHPLKLPKIPVKYLGPLSRFEPINQLEIKYKFFFMISGPEPQRTLLEQKVLQFSTSTPEKILIVLGKPAEKNEKIATENCTIYNHLKTKEMAEAIAASEFIVSRCGYTSVMEILALQKKSILIPTPGQTEQEYLAQHLMQQNLSYCFLQDEDLATNLKKAENFNYRLLSINSNTYKTILDNFVDSL